MSEREFICIETAYSYSNAGMNDIWLGHLHSIAVELLFSCIDISKIRQSTQNGLKTGKVGFSYAASYSFM